jgi:FdhD protein
VTPSRDVRGEALDYANPQGTPRAVTVPVEVPVNIIYATLPHAVMMATPADLEDFALGFSITEGVVTDPGEIRGITISAVPRGIVVDVDLVPAALRRHMARRRSMAGRTGCGICGIESLDQLPAARPVSPAPAIAPTAIRRALVALEALQPLHHATRAVHAAAWCSTTGDIAAVREDVGRHNALDKLIGACLRAGHPPTDGFVVMTSRCSFEMVEKTAAYRAATVVAISAPTSLAIDRAQALGITLIAIARPDGAIRFTAPGALLNE